MGAKCDDCTPGLGPGRGGLTPPAPSMMSEAEARVMLRVWAAFVAGLSEQRRDRVEAAYQAGLDVKTIHLEGGIPADTVRADLRARGITPPVEADRWTSELANPAQVSEFLGVPVQTLYQWRRKRTGPPAARIGRHLRYRWTDVQAWLDEQRSTSPVD